MGSTITSKNKNVGSSNLPSSKSYIWEEYLSDCKNNSLLSYEINQKTLTYNNKSLSFDLLIKGDIQKHNSLPLYLVLHNGIIGQPSYNNGEFLKARLRYQSCIHNGVICGVRGVTDLSNMHYCKESIILLDRLIKNFIVFYNVDPDKIYIIGLGFGGDAVYQIINLLSFRFAAAVVISGHSYGKSLKNVLNVHLLIQVGENDYYFDKNKDAVLTYKRIKEHYKNFTSKVKELNKISNFNSNSNNNNIKKKNNLFIRHMISSTKNSKSKNLVNEKSCCECFIIVGCSNEINDSDKKETEVQIISDPIKWMISDIGNEIIYQNINSISFLNKFIRKSLPKSLYWDLSCTLLIPTINTSKNKDDKDITNKDTRTAGEGFFNKTLTNTNTNSNKDEKLIEGTYNYNQYFYWLEIGNINVNTLGCFEVITRYETKSNSVFVDSPIKYLRILLNDVMMDLEKEINVFYNGTKQTIKVTRNYQTERRTLIERGDYTYIFSVALIFESKDGINFRVYQYEER